MEKRIRTYIRVILEIIIFSAVTFFVNKFFFPNNPGFTTGLFNPYYALSILVAAYYGKSYGFFTFFIGLFLYLIPLQDVNDIYAYWISIWDSQHIRMAIQLVGIYVLGLIRDSYTSRIKNYKIITRKEVFEKFKYKKEMGALKSVNKELEERVLRQNESVTSLYSQIKALHTQSLTETLNLFLNAVNKFSWAEKASIWRFDSNNNNLVMIANKGWEMKDFENSILDVDESIEGWCFRNNKIFSVRMLSEYDNLRRLDKKRNILTFPINFSVNAWGILNIEDMPFPKYNLYIEKILSILVDLASPEIERAVEYESVVAYDGINEYTELPAFKQFNSLITKNNEKASKSNSSFSIIIIEIMNFSSLINEFGEEKSYKLMLLLLEKLNALSQNKIDYFHYKQSNQLAIYYPNIDYDGVSLFCLETLGIINSTNWNINDTSLVVDAILGYSSRAHQDISVDELYSVAENLLEMQKV